MSTYRGRKAQIITWFTLIVMLLPFAEYFVTGLTAIAETTNSKETQLFEHADGNGKLSYREDPDQKHLNWAISYEKVASELGRQIGFVLRNGDEVITPQEISSEPADLFNISEAANENDPMVIQTKATQANENVTLNFKTEKLDQLSIVTVLNEFKADGSQEDLFAGIPAVDVAIQKTETPVPESNSPPSENATSQSSALKASEISSANTGESNTSSESQTSESQSSAPVESQTSGTRQSSTQASTSSAKAAQESKPKASTAKEDSNLVTRAFKALLQGNDQQNDETKKAPVENNKQSKTKAKKANDSDTRIGPQATGNDIRSYDTNDVMKTSPDGKTIMDNAQFFQGNPPVVVTDKSKIKVDADKDTELSLNYNWSIPENVRSKIQPGDYFDFELPGKVMVKPGSHLTGNLTDGTTVFGTYEISSDGKVRFIFNENIRSGSNAKGTFGVSMLVDKDSFGEPGKVKLSIPFTDESTTVTPSIVIPNNQNLTKEFVDEGTTKDEDITNNQGVVRWKLTANKMGFKMTDATITDTLPKGVTYKANSYKVLMYAVKEDRSGFEGAGIDITNSVAPPTTETDPTTGQQKVIFKLPDDSNGTSNSKYAYEVYFDSNVNFNEDSLQPKPPGWTQAPTSEINNNAELNSNEAQKIPASSTKTFTSKTEIEKQQIKTNNESYKPVKPTTANNFSNGVFTWKVDVKKQGLDLVPGTVMSDSMNYGQELTDESGVPLVPAEIQALVEQAFHEGGKNNGKKVVVTTDTSGDNKYIFTFPDGVSDSFTLNYHSNMKGQVGIKYGNTFTWNNKGHYEGNDTQPIGSKGIKNFQADQDGNPIGLDKGQVTWEIQVNTNTQPLDSWYVKDKLSGPDSQFNGADSFKVYEVDDKGNEHLLDRDTGDYDITGKDGTYTITYPRATSSKFIVRYTSSYDKDSNDLVKNDYEYHYITDGKDWHTTGTKEFQPKPVTLGNISGSKKGEYFFDTNDQKDKVNWTVTINDNKTTIGPNGVFYDPIPAGQTLDTSIEPEVFDESGNKVDAGESWNLNLKGGPAWSYVKPNDNHWYGKFLNISKGSNPNGTLVVGSLPQDDQKYTIKFTTKLAKSTDPNDVKETVTNTGHYRDDANTPIEVEAKASFQRNSRTIDKSHKVNPVGDDGKQKVDYTVVVNQAKKRLENVIVEDSNWQNIEIDHNTVKVVASTGKVLTKGQDYTIDKTGQQMFIRFNGVINDSYTVTYSGDVIWNGIVGQSINVSNSAKVTGDGIEEKTEPSTSGWKAKIPDSVATVTVENGSLKIIKVDSKDPTKKLANATFDLVKAETDKTGQVKYDQNDKAEIAETTWKDVVTNDQGEAEFTGLVTGSYFLVETSSPDTYYISDALKEHRNDSGQIDPGRLIEINVEDKDQKNLTYTIENPTLPIAGEKIWFDDDDQNRPTEITVHLMRDDQKDPVQTQTVTAGSDGKWKYEFTGIPKFDSNGNEIKYSVQEDSVKGYHTYYDGTNIINTVLTKLEGMKKWSDGQNNSGTRPTEITVALNKRSIVNGKERIQPIVDENNKPMTKVVIGDAKVDNWNYEFTDVPKYGKDGKPIDYVVTDKVTGYNSRSETVNGKVQVENFNPPAMVKLTGEKKWHDTDDTKRPQNIYIQVMKKVYGSNQWVKATVLGDESSNFAEKVLAPQEVKASNGWKYEVNNLSKYENGQLIEYSIKEVDKDGQPLNLKNYLSTVGTTTSDGPDAPDEYTVDVTNTETVEFKGEKIWEDRNNQDGIRPASIEVQLMQKEKGAAGDPQKVGQPQKVQADDSGKWNYSFKDLPKFNEQGKEIVYSVVEVEIPAGYEAPDYSKTPDIVNTYTPETIKLSGKKIWNDGDNQDGKRPDKIAVQLMARTPDQTEEQAKEVAKVENVTEPDWMYDFKDQPKFKDGKPLIYTVKEEKIPDGYTVKSEMAQGSDSTELNLTNSRVPEVTRLSGQKVWKDNDAKTRPDMIKVQLMKSIDQGDPEPVNGVIEEVRVNPSGKWNYTFSDLPKYEKGKTITYSVKEVDVPAGYKSEVSKDGKTLTNTLVTELRGTKTWNDNNDSSRPSSITVQLLANGNEVTGKTTKAEASNGWSYEFKDLERFDDQGEEITYSVKELDVPAGYKSEVDGKGNLTNTLTTGFSGKKIWNDNDDANRPNSVTIQLMKKVDDDHGHETLEPVKDKNGKAITRELTTKSWTYEFTNLAKFDGDQEIQYAVKEVDVPAGYVAKVAGNNIINTKVVEVPVKKVWDDSDNQDGKRPKSVKFQLLQKIAGEPAATPITGKEIELNAQSADKDNANVWSHKFTDLPKYTADGKEITYSVQEVDVAAGYESDVSKDGKTITNRYTPEVTEFSGEKLWDDKSNPSGTRPTKITVRLMNGKQKVTEQTVTAGTDGKWTYKFENLPKYENGKVINYEVQEEPVKGYSTKIDKGTITNTNPPETVEVAGVKEWQDEKDRDGKRPTAIHVQLMKKVYGEDDFQKATDLDQKGIAPVEVSAAKGWSFEFKNLPKYENGKAIEYSVQETDVVKGYKASVDNKNMKHIVLTNTYQPETVEFVGEKVWNDNNNQSSKRPNEITVRLMNGTQEVAHQVVKATEGNRWTYKFENLPKYQNGKVIHYEIQEDAVPGYSTRIEGTTITNTSPPETTKVTGKKSWDDDNDQAKKRPDAIKVQVMKQVAGEAELQKATDLDGNPIDALDVSNDTNWSYELSDLPKYEKGKAVVYIVQEVDVPAGYRSEISGWDLKNSYQPDDDTETTKISGKKYWNDQCDQDNLRPTNITVSLLQNGEVLQEMTVNAQTNWEYIFDDLPKVDSTGKAYSYTVAEKNVPAGYTASVCGYDITNTHEPEEPKTPDDDDPKTPNTPSTPDTPNFNWPNINYPNIPSYSGYTVPSLGSVSVPERSLYSSPGVSIPSVATRTSSPTGSSYAKPQVTPLNTASGKNYPQMNDKKNIFAVIIGLLIVFITGRLWYRRKKVTE
ncbi:Cna B-type domain-containing protein [Enterococcus sp. CSURQ0835]|uniref:Cna B-type domain-containing protein n=1 Tax=Enterococcus sp. CSURQ0835 TaxID=2681394 RepID=UPI00135BA0DA|nr:Cna B-type domain-containing protein [Enterococcus sp. CSURQ0835]